MGRSIIAIDNRNGSFEANMLPLWLVLIGLFISFPVAKWRKGLHAIRICALKDSFGFVIDIYLLKS